MHHILVALVLFHSSVMHAKYYSNIGLCIYREATTLFLISAIELTDLSNINEFSGRTKLMVI